MAPQAAVGVDTEFMRERTYYAQLCLLQLGTPGLSVCVDPLAIQSLDPLRPLMSASATCKILHAARQDLEVLAPVVGNVAPVFDTQVAAALVGFPAQVGYAELVSRIIGVELHKSQTRTDWSRRPLSAAQLDYALDDVRHLPPLREALGERLERLGRKDWFDEEMALLAGESYSVDPDLAWLPSRRLRIWTRTGSVSPASWRPGANGARSAPIVPAAGSFRMPPCAISCCRCRAIGATWRACESCRKGSAPTAARSCWS